VSHRPSHPPTATESLDAGSDGRHRVKRFWLHVIEGPTAGVSHGSGGERTTIGSQAGCDLLLDDRTVSRFHCEIEVRDGVAILRDLGSRNGTQIGAVTVREAVLDHGAVLILGRSKLRFEQGADLVRVPASAEARFGKLLGKSLPMQRAFALLERVAEGSAAVLLVGEPGTGKATAASALHEVSARREGPLVTVDCGTTAADVASSLFGDAEGAGALAAARAGTLVLEEIGALSPELQSRLIHALDALPRDDLPALVSTSRHDLRAAVNGGTFRADLHYRLAVVVVRLPPLRERLEDLPILVRHLSNPDGEEPSPSLIADLSRRPWPGNVAELRNHVERLAALGNREPLAVEASALPLPEDAPLRIARERALERFERDYLERLLARTQGNVAAAARAAGVDRVHLYRLLWRYGLK
jgi:two-component system, NtrC family, response regulator GlrR